VPALFGADGSRARAACQRYARAQVLVLGKDCLAWTSKDAGLTWESAIVNKGKRDGYIVDVQFHPTQPAWVLARAVKATCFTASPSDFCSFEVRGMPAGRLVRGGARLTGSPSVHPCVAHHPPAAAVPHARLWR